MRAVSAGFLLGCAAVAHGAPQAFGSIAMPGAVRWDYVTVDVQSHRLYVAHKDRIAEQVDARRR